MRDLTNQELAAVAGGFFNFNFGGPGGNGGNGGVISNLAQAGAGGGAVGGQANANFTITNSQVANGGGNGGNGGAGSVVIL